MTDKSTARHIQRLREKPNPISDGAKVRRRRPMREVDTKRALKVLNQIKIPVAVRHLFKLQVIGHEIARPDVREVHARVFAEMGKHEIGDPASNRIRQEQTRPVVRRHRRPHTDLFSYSASCTDSTNQSQRTLSAFNEPHRLRRYWIPAFPRSVI